LTSFNFQKEIANLQPGQQALIYGAPCFIGTSAAHISHPAIERLNLLNHSQANQDPGGAEFLNVFSDVKLHLASPL
jgi:hypothetical protein